MKKMDLFDLYLTACADNNTQQSGHFRPQLEYQAWLKAISMELFNGRFDSAENNQRNDDQFDHAFKVSINAIVTDVPGKNYDQVAVPTNYGYFAAMRAFKNTSGGFGCLFKDKDILRPDGTCGSYDDPDFVEIRARFKSAMDKEKNLRKIPTDKWGSALDHKLKKVSFDRPIMTQIDGGFRISPKGLGIVLLDYYRYPVDPYFAYTQAGDNGLVYDLANSIQLDWPASMEPQFLAAIKKRFASKTSQDNKYQQAMAEEKKNS